MRRFEGPTVSQRECRKWTGSEGLPRSIISSASEAGINVAKATECKHFSLNSVSSSLLIFNSWVNMTDVRRQFFYSNMRDVDVLMRTWSPMGTIAMPPGFSRFLTKSTDSSGQPAPQYSLS